MDQEQNQPLLHSGAGATKDRINSLLSFSQAEPEIVDYRINLATEILTLLSKKNKEEEYKEFEKELKKYKELISPIIRRSNAQIPYSNEGAIMIRICENELINLNNNFDLVIRKVLRKYDIIMVDKKSTDKPIISEETEGDLK